MKREEEDPRIRKAIQKFDIVEFLENNDVQYSLTGKNIGNNYIGIYTCCQCGKPNYHAAIHKDKKFYTCFVCKTYFDLIGIIAHYKHMSRKNAIKYLLDDYAVDMDFIDIMKEIYKKESPEVQYKRRPRDIIIPSRRIFKMDLERNKLVKSFFKERRLTHKSAIWYDLRIPLEKPQNKIIFPIYSRKDIVSYQWRRMDKKQYHLPSSVGHYLYNEDDITPDKDLILVEGILDYIAVDTYLRINKLKDKIIATTGFTKNISEEQFKILNKRKPKKIFCMFDSDAWEAYYRVSKKVLIDVDYAILPKGHDPSSLPLFDMERIISELL